MIKKLLGLLIIGFSIISFGYTSELCPVSYSNTPLYTFNLNEETLINDRQSNSNFTLKSNFNFLTENSNYNGLYFFANNPWTSSYSLQTYLFWTLDGLYYVYGGSSSPSDFSSNVLGQGYINYFCKVDSIDGFCRINSVNSCSTVQGYSLISSGSVYSNSDYSNPDIMKVFATSSTMVNFCFVYTDLGFTLCAPVGTNSICASNNVCVLYSSNLLTATDTVDPLTIDESVMTSSPRGDGGGGSGSSWGSDIDLSCTKQTALNWYERYGYSKNLCYGGLTDYTIYTGTALGTLPIYGSGEDFEEIWLNTADLRYYGGTGSGFGLEEWFIYWRGLYNLYNRGAYDSNPFLNTPFVLFTYFGAIDAYGSNLDSKSIVEYCELKLYTSDYTVDYTGVNQNIVCSITNLMVDQGRDIISGSGNGINVVGTGEKVSDGVSFVTNFYDLLKDKIGDFDSDNNSPILPSYIIWAFIGLLIFRFLSH